MRMYSIVTIAALAGATLAAQTPGERRQELAKQQLERFVMEARVPLERMVTGAPYSAETVTETNQALADGNRISRKTTGRVYRDGEGRIRREEDRQDGTVAISIVDPVAGVAYSLDPDARIAWKTPSEVTNRLILEAAGKEA